MTLLPRSNSCYLAGGSETSKEANYRAGGIPVDVEEHRQLLEDAKFAVGIPW